MNSTSQASIGAFSISLLAAFVVLSDTATVTLAWDANEEEDVVGYRLHYGFRSGMYVTSVDAGNVTTNTVTLPVGGEVYFFAATAYSRSGLESAFSNEVSYEAPEEPDNLVETNPITLVTQEGQRVEIGWSSLILDLETTVVYVADPPALGRFNGVATNLIYEPRSYANGVDAGRLILVDANRNALKLEITIEIEPVNDPPLAYDSYEWTESGLAVWLFLSAYDPDGDDLGYEILSGPNHGRIEGDPPELTYWPHDGYTGLDQLTFRVSDGEFESDPATVIISVEPARVPPYAVDLDLFTGQGRPLEIDLGNDSPHSEFWMVLIIEDPVSGTLSGTSPIFVYTPDPGFLGEDTFTYAVGDEAGGLAYGLVTIFVQPVNHPPVAHPATYEMTQADTVSISLESSDPDAAELMYRIIEPPLHGRLLGDPPDFIYAPHLTFSGTDQFTYAVSDGTLESAPATVGLTVVPLDDPSVLAPRIVGMERLHDGQVRITWESRPGGVYRLISSDGLDRVEWHQASPEMEAEETTLSVEVQVGHPDGAALYAVVLVR